MKVNCAWDCLFYSFIMRILQPPCHIPNASNCFQPVTVAVFLDAHCSGSVDFVIHVALFHFKTKLRDTRP